MARKSSTLRIGWRLIPALVMPFVTVIFYWKVFAAKVDVHSLCVTWGLALPMLGLVAYRGNRQQVSDAMSEPSRPLDWREEPDDSSASDALRELEKQLEPPPRPKLPPRLSTFEFFWAALVQPTRAFADLKQGLRAEILLFPCVFGLLIPFAWPTIFRAQWSTYLMIVSGLPFFELGKAGLMMLMAHFFRRPLSFGQAMSAALMYDLSPAMQVVLLSLFPVLGFPLGVDYVFAVGLGSLLTGLFEDHPFLYHVVAQLHVFTAWSLTLWWTATAALLELDFRKVAVGVLITYIATHYMLCPAFQVGRILMFGP